jgi:hypothetical protein
MIITALRKIFSSLLLLALCVSCIPRADKVPAISSSSTVPAADEPATVESTLVSTTVPDLSTFNIILGRPTDRSIAVSLYARQDAAVTITYSPASGNLPAQTLNAQLQAFIPQTLELTALNADTEYVYEVSIDGKSISRHTFHTQRNPGSTFTFTIDADPHNRDPNFNGELYAAALINALTDQPDFHINLGDTFMTEKLKPHTYAEAECTFTDMRPYFGLLSADVPLFLVNGNHEGELGWLLRGKDPEMPTWSTQIRHLYYPNPIPNSFYSGASIPDPALMKDPVTQVRDGYYAWTWGDALFVVLDPFWYTIRKPQPADLNNNWNWTLGKVQYEWLQSTLETSPAKIKFIFIHHLVGGNNTDGRGGIETAPYFEWGGKNADGTFGFDEQRPGWGKPIHQLLVDNQVSAVFHGHDHVYVRQILDGVVYQEVPQPSMAQYDKTSLAADYGYLSGEILGSSGHLRVTVAPDLVTVEYVRAYLPKDTQPGQVNGQVDAQYNLYP